MKYYYSNLLASQNITSKTNTIWVADITEVEVDQQKKFYMYLCVDAHANKIIAATSSKKNITSQAIVNCLKKTIEKRFKISPSIKVILHSDRGTQFSSKTYYNFINQFEDILEPSMSRENTPTDNAIAERFMRTFKEHLIDGKTIEQFVQESALLGSKSYRNIVNLFVQSLNKKPNKKSLLKSAEKHDKSVTIASMLMAEPKYPKAFSERFGKDPRRNEISKYKLENAKVTSILEELAAKRAEIVDETPFDNFDDNLALKLIDKRLTELYELIYNNPLVIKQYVKDAIEPVGEDISQNVDELREEFLEEMEILNKKIDILLPKNKKQREIKPLRDPIDINLFPIFFNNAGNSSKYTKDLKRAQLRITYTILYHCGLRINEIRHLTQQDLLTAIDAAQFNLVHHKTKKAHIHVLSKTAIQDFKNLKVEFSIVFEKYKYKFLYGKYKPMTKNALIRMVNQDLEKTCETNNIPFNIKSHSFRINMITNLFKITSVQNTADIIGHSDIRSTMSYNRYALSKTEIQSLLDQLEKNH